MLVIDESADGGGPAHAEANYNPWHHWQFGIVNKALKWRVWNIEGNQSRLPRAVREVAMGLPSLAKNPRRQETGGINLKLPMY